VIVPDVITNIHLY